MQRKYMFFDIDGTLTCGLLGKQPIVSDLTKQTLRQLEEKGHFLAIATGRPYFMAKDIAKEVGISNIVCNGGNDVYIEGECRLHAPFDHDLALSLITQCIEKDIAFCVSISNDFIRYAKDDAFLKLIEGKHFLGDIKIDPHFDFAAVDEYQRLFIDKKRAKELSFQGIFVGSSYNEVYVIVEPDDKYAGIRHMIELLGGLEDDVVVFGDGNNDIRMFQEAPCSIAMGNGIEELKQIANFVTHRSDEDGIAFACQHFGWL